MFSGRNEVSSFEAARTRLLRILQEQGYNIKHVDLINHSRYMIVRGDPENIMIIYKREPFYNFGQQFRSEGYKGVGDSINVEDLKTAIQREVTKIYTIFPNANAYSISMQDFLCKSIKWVTQEGKEVRSISIHEYKKEFEI